MSFVKQWLTPFLKRGNSQINANQVIDPTKYEPLLMLLRRRQLLKVALDSMSGEWQTMIVDINLVDKTLTLDGFSPTLTDRTSVIGQPITVTHQSLQQVLSFSGTIGQWQPATDAYSIELPLQAPIYQPRRVNHRLVLSGYKPLYGHIKPIFGMPWNVTIKNISAGGMRVAVNGDIREALQAHSNLPQCRIDISPSFKIITAGEICGFRFTSKPSRTTEISIAFKDMDSNSRADLEQFMQSLSQGEAA